MSLYISFSKSLRYEGISNISNQETLDDGEDVSNGNSVCRSGLKSNFKSNFALNLELNASNFSDPFFKKSFSAEQTSVIVDNFNFPGIDTIRYNEYNDIQNLIMFVSPLRMAFRSPIGINLGRPLARRGKGRLSSSFMLERG